VPTGVSDGLYIYRRNALPDEEFNGGAENVLREKVLIDVASDVYSPTRRRDLFAFIITVPDASLKVVSDFI
jgi:hypothetical protein